MLAQFETAFSTLEGLQAEMVSLLEAMGAEGMNWVPPLAEANSAYAIANHAAASQYWWIKENLGGETIKRDRPAEFVARANDLQELKNEIDRVQAESRAVLERVPFEELQSLRKVRQREVTVEWIVLHVIEHTALHLGHMQITRQLWEGQTRS